MATTSDFRNGLTILLDGEIWTIVEFLHVNPGKGTAFVRTKLKNLKTGRVIDRTFRSGEKVEDVRIERKTMQYLYQSEGQYVFMDTETYEQVPISEEMLGDKRLFLKEGQEVEVLFHGETPVGVELPFFVELAVAKTEPGVRGDTASGGSKPATLETGAVIQVPLFINEGDILKVDTRTGEYIERVR
ncbi:MAG: elongation factor P [Calditrichaeota bacterium]|nr:elongation factor P [Calditrichota bacterium]